MQLYQLEYFLAVAETGSFTRGAERARVVQSAVSAAIAGLERELGAAVFERAHHRLDLTAAGEALLPHAREALAAVAAAKNAVAGSRGEIIGTVTLGTMAYTGQLDVAAMLQAFQARFPRVAVHLRQTIGGSETTIAEVRNGKLDLALVSTPTTSSPGLAFDAIGSETLQFICAAGHRLATKRVLSFSDLIDEPFIDYPRGWGNRTIVDVAFAAAGIQRSIRTEVTDIPLACALVRRGLGVSFLPDHATDDTVVTRPLAEQLRWPMALVRPTARRESQAARHLAEAIRAWAGRH